MIYFKGLKNFKKPRFLCPILCKMAIACIFQGGPGDLDFLLPMTLLYLNKSKTCISLPRRVFFIFELGHFPPQGAVPVLSNSVPPYYVFFFKNRFILPFLTPMLSAMKKLSCPYLKLFLTYPNLTRFFQKLLLLIFRWLSWCSRSLIFKNLRSI